MCRNVSGSGTTKLLDRDLALNGTPARRHPGATRSRLARSFGHDIHLLSLIFDRHSLARARSSSRSRAFCASEAARSSSGPASPARPSFARRSPRTLGQSPHVQAFLLDPHVSAALSRWGIGFDATSVDVQVDTSADVQLDGNEVAYKGCGPDWPWLLGGPNDGDGCTYNGCSPGPCVDWNIGAEKGEFRCCWDFDVAAERRCTEPNSSNSCGSTGPQGCSVCWFDGYTEGCNAWYESGAAALCYE